MKRTKSVKPQEGQIKFVNYGGPFYPKNSDQPIPNKGTFFAFPSEVPVAFRDNIRPADPIAAAKQVEEA
ncbi:MAG: hypothetical protein ACWGQW_20655, partial [bacterium]